MSYLTRKQLEEAIKNPTGITPEERKKARDLQEKIQSLSKEELEKFWEQAENDW